MCYGLLFATNDWIIPYSAEKNHSPHFFLRWMLFTGFFCWNFFIFTESQDNFLVLVLSSQFFASRENKVLCFCCWAEVGWVIEREKRSFSLEITQPTSAKQQKHWTLVSRDAKNWLGSTKTKKLSWRTVKIKKLKQKKHVKTIRRKDKWGLWFF